MFPFRTPRALSALLEVADAMLAPAESREGATGDVTRPVPARRESAAHAHPHRQPLASRRLRRPAPPRPLQPCISPVARATPAAAPLRDTPRTPAAR